MKHEMPDDQDTKIPAQVVCFDYCDLMQQYSDI